jgi:hypothetical protein
VIVLDGNGSKWIKAYGPISLTAELMYGPISQPIFEVAGKSPLNEASKHARKIINKWGDWPASYV